MKLVDKKAPKPKKAPKLSKEQVAEKIESLGQSIKNINEDIKNLTKFSEKWDGMVNRVRETENRLNAYTNRFSTEVRVLPEGHDPTKQGGNNPDKSKNGWESYSGAFYLSPEERKQILIDRAREHFKDYFKDGIYHRNKKLGLFVSGGGMSGKQLIEEMETGD
jgi:hypothetical protein